MARSSSDPQIVTANRLADGVVVYWAGGWVEALGAAEVLHQPDAVKAALEAAAASVKAREVVNPYAFAVRLDEGTAVPVKEREIIRASGPSVHPDLGKQAVPATAPHFLSGRPAQPPSPKPAEGAEAFDVSL